MAHIHRAARLGNLQDVAAALDAGAEVNHVSIHHFTPLMLAAREGYLPIVQLLLDKGADPTLAHPNGRTILHLAASKWHEEIVSLLIAAGANPNVISKRGDSPAIEAAHFNHFGVVEVLRQGQADMTYGDREGRTVADWLALGGVPGLFQKKFGDAKERLNSNI